MKARRIAVVCGELAYTKSQFSALSDIHFFVRCLQGAGISVQAGIPDFRSSEGLFQTLKRDNPTLSSGKDLFDASVFNVSFRIFVPLNLFQTQRTSVKRSMGLCIAGGWG